MQKDILQKNGRQGNALPANLAPDRRARVRKLMYFGTTGVPTALILDILSNGQHGACAVVGLVIGGTCYYFEEEIHTMLGPALNLLREVWAYLTRNRTKSMRVTHRLLSKEWWLSGELPVQYAPPDDQAVIDGADAPTLDRVTLDARFVVPSAEDTGGIARLTIEEIVTHTERNSYQIWIGRSLTRDDNPGVRINFYKQHFKCVGTSQRGKSSMAAALMDIITRTHDTNHVRLVLLDRENRTSNLFAHLPHVLQMKSPEDGRLIKMHARDDETVLRYLIHCVAILKKRTQLPVEVASNLPIIIVFIEEFLRLKDYFRLKIRQAKGAEARAKAESDFATLVYCISEIAGIGLKYRMQLLLCAQVDYADDDFREALINVQCGFAFCLRPKAAEAAGFMQTQFIRQNAKADKPGQCVVETPDCKDLVLAPQYPLEELLRALEKVHPELFIVSGFHENQNDYEIEHEKVTNIAETGNAGNDREQPEKRGTESGNGRERFPESGNTPQQFDPALVAQVIGALQELTRDSEGKRVTRRQLKEKLGYSGRRYSDELKPLCDTYNILMDDKEGE